MLIHRDLARNRPPPAPAPKATPAPQAAPAPAPAAKSSEPETAAVPEPTQEEEAQSETVEEVKQEEIDLSSQQLDQPEIVESQPEVPEPIEVQEPEPAQTQEDPLQEPEVAAAEPMKDPWASVQAPPSAWEQSSQQVKEPSAPVVPEASKPSTDSYAGPPGFNPAVKAAIAPVRTNSRAALRYKTDKQAVMLPGSGAAGSSNLDMKFGSLSFGNPDADEQE